jgi:tetratricopeptide (TPR) repeat protein
MLIFQGASFAASFAAAKEFFPQSYRDWNYARDPPLVPAAVKGRQFTRPAAWEYSCCMPRIAPLLASLLLLPLQSFGAGAVTDDRPAIYRQYREAFDAGDLQKALPLAVRVVELTSNQFGNEAVELVNPLTNVATTLYRLRQHGEAIDAYRRALTLLDQEGDATDPRFVVPLHGLGATLRAMGRDEEAIVPLKRAVDIIRNRDGLHAPAQLPILRALVASYEAVGRTEDAGREHQYAFTIAEQAWGANDPRMIEALEELADWYEATGRYTAARLLHMRAVEIADREQPMSLKAIGHLSGIARAYRLAFIHGENSQAAMTAPEDLPDSLRRAAVVNLSVPSSDGERALRDALQRLEPQLGVPALVTRRLLKYGRYLLITVLARLRSIVCILVSGL